MSVPKSHRKKSRFEVFHNMAMLQKELVLDLMTDFGITRMTSLGEAQFLDIKFERIVNLCGDIVGDTNRANAIYVTSKLEYERRKLKKYRKMVNRGIVPLTDVQNSFKSWYCNYQKIMSYRTKQNMLKIYHDLFA